jgi:hypothetical protein
VKDRIPVTIAAVLIALSVGAIAQDIPKIELAGGYSIDLGLLSFVALAYRSAPACMRRSTCRCC